MIAASCSDETRKRPAFASNGGLVLGTVALYVFLQHVKEFPDDKAAIRQLLRTTRGNFGLGDARAWIERRQADDDEEQGQD